MLYVHIYVQIIDPCADSARKEMVCMYTYFLANILYCIIL